MMFRKDNIFNPPVSLRTLVYGQPWDAGQSGAPGVEDFSLWLTLEVGHSGAPDVDDFSLWLTLEVGHSGAPDTKVFVTTDWLNIWLVIGRWYVRF